MSSPMISSPQMEKRLEELMNEKLPKVETSNDEAGINCQKRSLNLGREDYDDGEGFEIPKKRSRMQQQQQESPQKRMSTGSVGSNESTTKKIGRIVTGQLVTKNMYSVNNEPFYLFKFLIENVSKNYYGNASHFQTLRIDTTYEVELVYENKRLNIAKITECKDREKIILMKRFVEQSDFDGEDTISVAVKLKYGFKVIESDAYKVVFIVNYGETYETCYQVQIECMANLKRWSACIKDASIVDENDLLEYFYKAQDKMFSLCRVKCQQSNGNYKNFSIQNITQMQAAPQKPVCTINEDPNNISSISRSNKRVLEGLLKKITVERDSEYRFTVSYMLKDENTDGDLEEESVRASIYIRQQQNEKKNKVDKLEKLETDLNQLNELIDEDIVNVYIYVTVDLISKAYNVLGLTKYEIDSGTFEGL
ncbi:LEF-3 [Agrotis segetum nucleopolyhedrovirus A]|uniref:LEF-3 n=1 Tax=Agrotis segetum nuclear polyhedrosis virus TaxID=1962501 RepID=Q287H4_NPVAS|nr:LEF-3 [Agrotis segetum nucleopolyhedrovirus A]AAZ38264.1 LEF-3 [Agrotis segetum nucleopolyhedrovirus A]